MLSAAQAIQGSPITSYTDAFRKLMGGNKTATNTNTGTTDSALARYKELERKYLEGSISPDEGDELWRLEGMKGAIGSVSTSLETLRQAKATDAFNDYLAEKIKEEYTQSEYTASEFREFDNDGTPLFEKSKETAGVQPSAIIVRCSQLS